jgi:hypothetical protein
MNGRLKQLFQVRHIVECNGSDNVLELIENEIEYEVSKRGWNDGAG